MQPWREIAVPNRDVLEGTFQQSEFAADITAVRSGVALPNIRMPSPSTSTTLSPKACASCSLRSRSASPVIQLQNAFGVGKTRTLLAVYHLANRTCPLANLVGVAFVIDQASLTDVPRAQVTVLDGNAPVPGQH
jgi:uncharacterized protein